MAFTYDNSDLGVDTASGRLNAVRSLIGDTQSSEAQLQDEEISFYLSQTGNNVYSAAAQSSRAIAAKYAREVNIDLDGQVSSDNSDLFQHYMDLAVRIEYTGTRIGARLGVSAGGLTKTDINIARANTNRIEPSFRRDRFKNPPNYEGSETGYDD